MASCSVHNPVLMAMQVENSVVPVVSAVEG